MSHSKKSRFQQLIPSSVRTPLALMSVLSFIATGIAAAGYFFLPPKIPLFYSLAQDSQQLAPKIYILILPVLSVSFSLVNTFLCMKLHKFDVLLLKLFAWFSFTLAILLTFSLGRIMYIVI